MKINRRIRIKVIKRIIKRLERLALCLPYSHTDPYKIFNEIMDWEEKLEAL